jgi:hypothetical protein
MSHLISHLLTGHGLAWLLTILTAAAGMAIAQGKYIGFQPNGLWPTVLGVALGGRNAFLKAWQPGVVTFTSAAVGATSITEQAVAVAGLLVNDIVIVMAQTNPTANAGNMGTSRVTVAGSLALRYINPTAAPITPPASSVFYFCALQVS